MMILRYFMYCSLSLISFWLFAKDLQKSIVAITTTHQEAKNSQKKINKLDDETKQLIQKYRITLNKTENLRIYNKQLESYILSQKTNILQTRKKIEQVKDTKRSIEPLMLRMLASLESFINLDVPFLLKQRLARIKTLKNTLNRSDVSVSEKYRQLIDTYSLEQDYGRTMQSYREIKTINGKNLTVDYLRLGRVTFIYKSLDGLHLAHWDKKQKIWKPLSKSHKKNVTKAIQMALKQIPPDLIRLPIPSFKN